MDPSEFCWNGEASNQHHFVSSLDLLEEEILRERKPTLQWSPGRQLVVEGEPAATLPREITKTSPRKPSVAPRPARRRSTSRPDRRSTNNEDEEEGVLSRLQVENENLQREVMQWRNEVQHIRDEKRELEESFRRLDKEIGNGYHLAERKEKELRIAELVTKNQKISQMLEKELHSHEDLRRAHAELQNENRKLAEQVTLLNQVVDSVEIKHSTLSNTHATLTASYEASQLMIEKLQSEVHALQDKLATSDTHVQIVADYERKIRDWERTCRDMEHKYEHNAEELAQTQQIATVAQQQNDQVLQRQEELEQELRSAHDLVIRTNAAMRTMEAKLEANLKAAQYGGNNETLNRRIRQVEGELLEKNRLNAELMQTCNQLLGPQKRSNVGKSVSARNVNAVTAKVAKLTAQISSLTGRLLAAEQTRDRKSQSLQVLLQALPFLLHRLDALQDRYAAAIESNEILQNAIEQMQTPPLGDSRWTDSSDDHSFPASMYVSLAREKYLLEAPFPIELLAEQTGARAFRDTAMVPTTMTKKKRFSPFRVTASLTQQKDNQNEVETDDQTHQLVMLAADPNDTSGASYLNRSKINAFLEIIQSRAARKKFKTLLIGKLADCLNKLRELTHRSASEAATQNAAIQVLQQEVAALQQKLKASHKRQDNNAIETTKEVDVCKTRQFILKVIDIYAEKQQQGDHRQMTFLTQPLTSDILITQDPEASKQGTHDDRLCLADCGLDDEDLRQLLLKILVSGVRFRHIDLNSNNISDVGAQHVADFIEKCSSQLQMISLVGNKRTTRRGFESIRRGLMRNQRVQRIDEIESMSSKEIILRGLAIQQEFDENGTPTEVLRVVLPVVTEFDEPQVESAAVDEAVDAMTEKLRQIGFAYNVRPSSALSRPRSAPMTSRARVPTRNTIARPRSASMTATPSSNNNSQRHQIKRQQELRFQSLESALRRASAPSRSISQTLSNNRPTSSRSSRRSYGKSHIDTVRGLRR